MSDLFSPAVRSERSRGRALRKDTVALGDTWVEGTVSHHMGRCGASTVVKPGDEWKNLVWERSRGTRAWPCLCSWA